MKQYNKYSAHVPPSSVSSNENICLIQSVTKIKIKFFQGFHNSKSRFKNALCTSVYENMYIKLQRRF